MNIFKQRPAYTTDEISIYVADLVEITKLRNEAEKNARLLQYDKGGKEAQEQWQRYNQEIEIMQEVHMFMTELHHDELMKRMRRGKK